MLFYLQINSYVCQTMKYHSIPYKKEHCSKESCFQSEDKNCCDTVQGPQHSSLTDQATVSLYVNSLNRVKRSLVSISQTVVSIQIN